MAKKTNNNESLDMIHANHAIMLISARRDADARRVVDLVNASKLDEPTRKSFEFCLKNLVKREAAAIKANPPAQEPEDPFK